MAECPFRIARNVDLVPGTLLAYWNQAASRVEAIGLVVPPSEELCRFAIFWHDQGYHTFHALGNGADGYAVVLLEAKEVA